MMINEIKDQCRPMIEDLEKIMYPTQARPKQLELIKNGLSSIKIQTKLGEVNLSLKEIQFLQQLRYGYDLPEIAGNLNRSRRTIESHINNIKNKLACNKRSELVMVALKQGLIR